MGGKGLWTGKTRPKTHGGRMARRKPDLCGLHIDVCQLDKIVKNHPFENILKLTSLEFLIFWQKVEDNPSVYLVLIININLSGRCRQLQRKSTLARQWG